MKLVIYCKKNWFIIATLVVVFTAIILRFYNYNDRWGLAYDQSHDVLIARYAIVSHKIPLLGPFSSAGPFVTGPEWYWLIMIGVLLDFHNVISPWFLLTCLFVVSVILMIKTGELLGSKILGIIMGSFTALSSAEIDQSINLANQAPLAILSILSLYLTALFAKTRKTWVLGFLGLTVGLGISIHLQGVLLLPVLFFVLIILKPTLKQIILGTLIFILPFLPLIYFDITHNFWNIRHMLQYYFHDQYKVSLDVLGRNWKNYLGSLIPTIWANIIGGQKIVAYGILVFAVVTVLIQGIKRNISKPVLVYLLSLVVSLTVARYTRTPLFDSYFMVLHAPVLLVTSLLVWYFWKKQKMVAIIIFLIICIGSFVRDIQEISQASNGTSRQLIVWENALIDKYPEQKFALYDYDYQSSGMSVPLSLYLDVAGKADTKGRKIGVLVNKKKYQLPQYPNLWGKTEGWQLVDLEASSDAQLQKDKWIRVSGDDIYHNTEEWFVGKKF